MIDFSFIDVTSVDYWYDEGYAQSQRALRCLTGSEWEGLARAWASQPLEWQDRLAYILGDGLELRESELLVDVYVAGHPDVAMTAAEGLRSMSLEHLRMAVARRLLSGSAACRDWEHCASANELLQLVAPNR